MKWVALIFSTIFIINTVEVSSQSLNHFEIIPANPTDQDSIQIAYKIVTSDYSSIIQDSIYVSGKNIVYNICLHITQATMPSSHKDTLDLGILPVDTYQINFTIYSSSDLPNNCIPKDSLKYIDTFIVVSAVSIEEWQIREKLKIYPNPVKNNLTIEAKNNLKLNDFTIQNIEGKTIQIDRPSTLNSHSINLNMESLGAGMYILILQTNEGVLRHKFVVQ